MNADIIEFPDRGRDKRLVSSIVRLEIIVREVERMMADEPAAGVDRLLTIMEHMGDRLVDLGNLVLDDDARRQAQSAFISLSEKIADTRDAVAHIQGRRRP